MAIAPTVSTKASATVPHTEHQFIPPHYDPSRRYRSFKVGIVWNLSEGA